VIARHCGGDLACSIFKDARRREDAENESFASVNPRSAPKTNSSIFVLKIGKFISLLIEFMKIVCKIAGYSHKLAT
jgi:hypothetical protein